MAAEDLVTSIIASITASGALTGLVIWFSREWISTRLKTGIQHEYDQKLEAHKAHLKAENEIAILELKTKLEREAALHAVAHASFAEGQKAAMERKLSAIDKLWNKILVLRSSLPPILTFIDILTVEEYKGAQNHPTFRSLTEELSQEKIASLAVDEGESIEKVRLYVGDYLWAVFFCYQAIMLRILFLMYLGRNDAAKIEWPKDQGIRQLMEAVLNSSELEEFEQTRISKVSWLQRRLESKILAASRKIISGEEFGAESLEQAKLIQQRAARVQADSKMA